MNSSANEATNADWADGFVCCVDDKADLRGAHPAIEAFVVLGEEENRAAVAEQQLPMLSVDDANDAESLYA